MYRKYVMLAIMITFILTGCKNTKKETTILAMDTVMNLTIYGHGHDNILQKAENLIIDLEKKLSTTNENSEISRINTNKTGTVSEHTMRLLEKTLSLCETTKGALDISIYPIVRAWGFTTENYQIPTKNQLEADLRYVNYKKINYNQQTNMITLEERMEIDFGSVAKGYTGDCLISLLENENITSAILNLGGNIQALGYKPDGSMWKVGIQDPFENGTEYFGVLQIANEAVVTSGSYERYFEIDGERYWHIIDPSTGMPARNGLVSVTIIGKSGFVCDGLSTALFVMGLEQATAFWQKNNDFEAIFVTEDGQVTITEGLKERFTLINNNANINQEMEVLYGA